MKRSLGTTLLAAGAIICVLGAFGLMLGMFVSIPEALARALVRATGFVAPFLIGGSLMFAGAVVRRASRAPHAADAAPLPPSGKRAAAELPVGHRDAASPPQAREAERVPRAT
jgi:hypothetical protein